MRIRETVILAVTALLALASCTKGLGVAPVGPLEMRLAPSLADGQTKASLTTEDLYAFWLKVDCPTDPTYSYYERITKTETGWKASRPLFWKNETTPVTYCAAFVNGYNFTEWDFSNSVSHLEVLVDQSTLEYFLKSDLLILEPSSIDYESTTDGALPITLKHGLSRVRFVLSLGNSYYDNGIGLTDNPVSNLKLYGIKLGYVYTPGTGEVVGKVSLSHFPRVLPLLISYTPGTASDKTSTAVFEAILPPQVCEPGSISVSFSIGPTDFEWINDRTITFNQDKTIVLPISLN